MITTTMKPQCILDESILNDQTLSSLHDIGMSFFAALCGRNRGVFVLHPTMDDNQTWGCTAFPPNFATIAGTNNTNITLVDANSIKNEYVAGNISSTDTIQILNTFIQMVYASSSNVEKDVYACELGGLAKLDCSGSGISTPSIATSPPPVIRSVTMAGVFTPASYVTGLTNDQLLPYSSMKTFYTIQDFQEMQTLGLNTVQIPFPLQAFTTTTSKTSQRLVEHLSTILDMIKTVGLQAILVLVGVDDDDAAITLATKYVLDHTVVMAMTLPSMQSYSTVRTISSTLKLFIPINQGVLKDIIFPTDDTNVYGAIDFGHATDIADVASSNSISDRMKMFYQEAKACILRSPLEYSYCYRHIPIFVASGFDLSIDNCIYQNSGNATLFMNYGQCDRFHETIDSNWWNKHRQSFASRQMFSYEHGLGWSYTTWKLYNDDQNGLLDIPAKLLAFKNVAAAGLITVPSVNENINMACLNPPVSDFILGDDTLAPSPAPPPDCGYGWWNESIHACSYWVPPVPSPTDQPTYVPTSEPIICPELPLTIPMTTPSLKSQLIAGTYGAIVAFILSYLIAKMLSSRRQQGYTTIS
jgi:hypothetical protein